jgi:ubiquinone/menaquinone biosynthesis C-methylase UbiE
MSVLDVGCGSGAITRGIADAVGGAGRVVGIDISEQLLALALTTHGGPPNLEFEIADVTRHRYRDEFDVVTAARVLQWLADPRCGAARAWSPPPSPAGRIIVLDYNHTPGALAARAARAVQAASTTPSSPGAPTPAWTTRSPTISRQ